MPRQLPLLPLLKEVGLDADVPLFMSDNTTQALDGTGLRCAPMGRELWSRYMASLQDVGYLPRPERC